MDLPLISVIIPVYNAQQYLAEAIQSVLSQSHTNLELKILDDGSNDKSVAVAKSFNDPRVAVLASAENLGPAYRLNQGIAMAKGEYISIMHADDIMHKQKLEKQLIFFKNNPKVSVCGCNVQLISGSSSIWMYPENDQECKDLLLLSVPFAHPTVVFKKSGIHHHQPLYNENMTAAEDYDLWVKLAGKCCFGNVQEVLLNYRIHPWQSSSTRKEIETKNMDTVRKLIVQNLFKIEKAQDILSCYNSLYHYQNIATEDVLHGVTLLWKANKRNKMFGKPALRGRLKHIVYEKLSPLTFWQKMTLIFFMPALFEISFFKSMMRIFFRRDEIFVNNK